jgi:hypothetical protein
MITLHEFVQLTLNRALRPEMQRSRSVQQTGEVKGRVFDQQIHVERKGLADRFPAIEGQDFQGIRQTGYIQTKCGLVDWIEHRRFSTGGAAGDSRRETWPSRELKYNLGNGLREKKTI